METKLIEYAYPTSTTASKNGYYKTGCWFVSLYKSASAFDRCKILKCFGNKYEAIYYAESLPNPYNLMHKYFTY